MIYMFFFSVIGKTITLRLHDGSYTRVERHENLLVALTETDKHHSGSVQVFDSNNEWKQTQSWQVSNEPKSISARIGRILCSQNQQNNLNIVTFSFDVTDQASFNRRELRLEQKPMCPYFCDDDFLWEFGDIQLRVHLHLRIFC